MSFADAVEEELKYARSTYQPFNSLHEAYAVILEEVKEFEAEVFRKPNDRHSKHILRELTQIAAMCQRAAEDCLSSENIN